MRKSPQFASIERMFPLSNVVWLMLTNKTCPHCPPVARKTTKGGSLLKILFEQVKSLLFIYFNVNYKKLLASKDLTS